MCSIERCWIRSHFVLRRFWRFLQWFPPHTTSKLWIYHCYIITVEIDGKSNKLTDSNAWVPWVTIFLFSAESLRNWQKLHESLLPLTIHEPRPQANSIWSAGINMEVMFVVLLIFSLEIASRSQHRHAAIPISMPNFRAHRRVLFTAFHGRETIFQRGMWLF